MTKIIKNFIYISAKIVLFGGYLQSLSTLIVLYN